MKRIREILGVAKVLVMACVLSLLVTAGVVRAAEKVDPSLVACWKFDEGGGDIAKDSSGNGLDGKIKGAGYAGGKFGKSLRFDGKSSVVVPHSDKLNIGEEISIELWIYPEAFPRTWKADIVAKEGWKSEYLLMWNLRRVVFEYQGTDGEWKRDMERGTSIYTHLKTWHHIVLTYSRSTKTAKLYINGELDKEYTFDVLPEDSNKPFIIGNQFKGMIDEVKVHNRVLSLGEIKTNYGLGKEKIDSDELMVDIDKDKKIVELRTAGAKFTLVDGDNDIYGALHVNNLCPIRYGYKLGIFKMESAELIVDESKKKVLKACFSLTNWYPRGKEANKDWRLEVLLEIRKGLPCLFVSSRQVYTGEGEGTTDGYWARFSSKYYTEPGHPVKTDKFPEPPESVRQKYRKWLFFHSRQDGGVGLGLITGHRTYIENGGTVHSEIKKGMKKGDVLQMNLIIAPIEGDYKKLEELYQKIGEEDIINFNMFGITDTKTDNVGLATSAEPIQSDKEEFEGADWAQFGKVIETKGLKFLSNYLSNCIGHPIILKGEECRENRRGFHFKIKDIARYQGKAAAVIVEYLDKGDFFVMYVSHLQDYGARRFIYPRDTGEWQRRAKIISDIQFGTKDRYHFRLTKGRGEKVFISKVWIKPVDLKSAKSYCKELKEVSEIYNNLLVLHAKAENDLNLVNRAVFYKKQDVKRNSFSINEFSASFKKIDKDLEEIAILYDNLFNKGSLRLAQGDSNYSKKLSVRIKSLSKHVEEEAIFLGKNCEKLVKKLKGQNRLPAICHLKKEEIKGLQSVEDPSLIKEYISSNVIFENRFSQMGGKAITLPQAIPFDCLCSSYPPSFLPFSQICHKPGEFDFSYFDKKIELSQHHGCRTFVTYTYFESRTSPKWLMDKYGDAVIARTREGKPAICHGWLKNQMSLYHPAGRKLTKDFFANIAKHYANSPERANYVFWGESGITDYSKAAESAFQVYLKRKIGNIRRLNKAWGSNYISFEKIEIPKEDITKVVMKTPLIYEYERFRRESLGDIINMCLDAFHKEDPNHPIGSGFSFYYNRRPEAGFDTYIMGNLSYDIFGAHDSGSTSKDTNYAYSINRFTQNKKIMMNDEYYWIAPEAFGRSKVGERILRPVAERNFFNHFTWGKQMFDFYTALGHGDHMLEPQYDYLLMRYCASVLPLMKNKMQKFLPIQHNTDILSNVAILQSGTSTILSYPSGTAMTNMRAYSWSFLSNNRYTHLFVPAKAIIDGKTDLSEFKVLLAPYATHILPELNKPLLNWIKKGGCLVASCPVGLYDHYSRKNMKIMKDVLGIEDIEYAPDKVKTLKRISNFKGILEGTQPINVHALSKSLYHTASYKEKKGVEVLAAFEDGSPAILSGSYGKGKLYLSMVPLTSGNLLNKLFLNVLKEAIPIKLADCDKGNLALVVREDNKGARYLFVVNHNPSKGVETEVKVSGEYKHLFDLDCEMPIHSRSLAGMTTFDLKLHPGAGTIIYLGRNTSNIEAARAGARINLLDSRIRNAKKAGANVEEYKKILTEAENLFKRRNYTKVLSLIKEELINEVTEVELKGLFKTTRQRLTEEKRGGANFIWLNLASSAWKGKDYDKAKEYIARSIEDIPDPKVYTDKKIAYAYRVRKEIKIDGSLDDWKGVKGTFLPSSQAIVNKRAVGAKIVDDKDISAAFYNGWDDKNYYFAIDVTDDVLYNKDPARIWAGDSIELFLDIFNDAAEDNVSFGIKDLKFQFGINKVFTQASHGSSTVDRIFYDVGIKEGGYTLEVSIPLEELGLDKSILSKGWTIGFDMIINDSDKEPMFTTADPNLLVSGMVILTWNCKAGISRSPFGWGKLTFVE